MQKKDDIYHSVLIVSASEQFDRLVKQSLKNCITIDSKKSVSLARRNILERYYDLVLINSPLPDETGEDFAVDVTENTNASVLLVTAAAAFENVLLRVSDYGVLVVPKPSPRGRIDKAIRFLTAVQNRVRRIEKKMRTAEEKLEDLRIVTRTKCLLIEKKHMTEEQAHRLIGKWAMDNGISRRRAAEQILEDEL